MGAKKQRGGKKKGGGKSSSTPPTNSDSQRTHQPIVPNIRAHDQKSQLRFEVGDRVNCHVGIDQCPWVQGTIADLWYCDHNDSHFVSFYGDGEVVPYRVRLDCGHYIYAPVDEDETIKKVVLRFKLGERVECRQSADGPWFPGTVARLWIHDEEFTDGRTLPYVVFLDNGREIIAPCDDDDVMKKSTVPHFVADLKPGARVECQIGTADWLPGIVLECHEDWVEKQEPPCLVRFDNGEERPFWGPNNCIRPSNAPAPTRELGNLRFNVGDRVECNVDEGWMPGTIIKTWYTDISFEIGHAVPYQIQLDVGHRIYAPRDEDGYIKRSTTPPPSCFICFSNEQTERNPIVRDCACRGDNGFVHVDCLVQLALAKTEQIEHMSDIDNPFLNCITCKQQFDIGSHSFSSLAKMCYESHIDDPIGSYWNITATRMKSYALVDNRDYDSARKILKEQIYLIGSKIEVASIYEKDNLKIILSNFLGELAQVYDEEGSLEEMKTALDESLLLIEGIDDDSVDLRLPIICGLGKHAHLTGDKHAALRYYEECIRICRAGSMRDMVCLSRLLSNSAALNLDLGNKERGIEQLEEVVKIDSTVYGRAGSTALRLEESLRKFREGSIGKIPLLHMGLGRLESRLP